MIIEDINTYLNYFSNNKFEYSLLIIALFIILAFIVKFIFYKIVPLLTKKTKTNIDDEVDDAIKNQIFYIILLIGIYTAIAPLGIPEKIYFVINKIILTFGIIFGTIIIIRLVNIFIDSWGMSWAKKTKGSLDDDLLPLFHKFSKIFIGIFAFIIIIKSWGFNITSLLAGVGIAGMILGLALKDTLSNIFSGVSIILDKNMKVGDKVMIGDDVGIIDDIGLRSSKLKTYNNELIIFPNNQLANSKIMNYTKPNALHKAVIKFGVVYGSEIDKVKKVVLEAIKNIPDAIYNDKEHEPGVVFTEMADFSLNFVAFIWSTHEKSFGVKLEATQKIYDALNKNKIGIPFPTRTVYLKKE